jgi:hypothetical protein
VQHLLLGESLPHLIPHFSRNRVDVLVALDRRQLGEYFSCGEELFTVHADGADEATLVVHSRHKR